MASPAATASHSEAAFYLELVPLQSLLPINVALESAKESTMISLLGSPQLPLTTVDQPERASPLVKALKVTKVLSSHVKATGIKPAVASASAVLKAAIAQEKAAGHDLDSVLGTEGMLNVRFRKPTSGAHSTTISNHAWGSAIDFAIVGHDAPGNTHAFVPRFIAVLVPLFNVAGWFSGIGFHDTMHFEVADGTIRKWAADGELKP